jgi:protein-L-isoaspartate(D-aspartate) O-methyltransferase
VGKQEDQRERLLRELRGQGITDSRVIAAFEQVRREQFVDEQQHGAAYRNEPLPIGEGQTISQPFVVALMLQELRLYGTEHVLEIGTGSGYQTALLAELAKSVVSVERHASLADRARERLARLGYLHVSVQIANGTLGWKAAAPYDAILVSAAAPEVPTPLLQQLAEGGRLILPVGSMTAQELVLVARSKDGYSQRRLGAVRFVPLVGREGWGGQPSAG